MRIHDKPKPEVWQELAKRPVADNVTLTSQVSDIMQTVKEQGDKALKKYAAQWDQVRLDKLTLSKAELQELADQTPADLQEAIKLAYANIKRFHVAQIREPNVIETMPGVRCWRRSIPIERVGLYIPGGSAPLFSTVLMLGTPAQIAGCKKVVMCSPATKEGKWHPAMAFSALLVGVEEVYLVGGAQAIAAMIHGTESVPRVDKIFGPGNQYVTRAKELAQLEGIPIDMPAGPSEVLIIADGSADAAFIATDLLAQAEHGPDSQVVLVTDSKKIVEDVQKEVEIRIKDLPRKDLARAALANSMALILSTLDECMSFSNVYAPEHLILEVNSPLALAVQVVNAGSVFLGHYTCESLGDYASGTNHSLPTNGHAKQFSGVALGSFIKYVTFQQVSREGLKALGPSVELMATAEGLEAHKQSVSIRLASI